MTTRAVSGTTALRRTGLLAAGVLLLSLVPITSASSAYPRTVATVEQDCYEFNEFQGVDVTTLPEALQTRFVPEPVPGRPGRAILRFVDYVCQDVTVDGRGGGRWTLTTMGIVLFVERDGVPLRGAYVLWHGTSNGRLLAALQRLGVDSQPLPRSTSTVTDFGDGRSAVTFDVVEQDVAHSRTATVPEPPAGPVVDEEPDDFRFWFAGRHGDVTLAYSNHFRPTTTGPATVSVPDDSGLHPYFAGLAQPVALVRPAGTFVRGSWEGELAIVP